MKPDRDCIDKRLIVDLALARSDRGRLPVGLCDELRRPHIWHPDLYGPKPLATQPLSVLAHAITSRRHAHTLHVTRGSVNVARRYMLPRQASRAAISAPTISPPCSATSSASSVCAISRETDRDVIRRDRGQATGLVPKGKDTAHIL